MLFPLDQGERAAGELGTNLAARYAAAKPFPHIVLDDFFDVAALDRTIADLASLPAAEHSYNRAQERLKSSYNPDVLPPHSRELFHFFNSKPFIVFVENLTGIRGLIPDPHFTGGGIHELKTGGHLDIHADFNLHPILQIERRVNVLIYLNKDWRDEFGGQFEMWDPDMKECCEKVVPLFNRCVVFNTTSDSYHGNPTPVAAPDGRSRFSIALYYYTATWDGSRRGHTTQFKPRPESQDRHDWGVMANELAKDMLPPFVTRMVKAMNAKRRA